MRLFIWCDCNITVMGFIPILCDCDSKIYTQKIASAPITPCEQFHKIASHSERIVPCERTLRSSINSATTPVTPLGPIYTKRQSQRCNNSVMTLAILHLLKTIESLKNGLQPHCGASPLLTMRTESLASSQSCCSVDSDAWCKWALKVGPKGLFS